MCGIVCAFNIKSNSDNNSGLVSKNIKILLSVINKHQNNETNVLNKNEMNTIMQLYGCIFQ